MTAATLEPVNTPTSLPATTPAPVTTSANPLRPANIVWFEIPVADLDRATRFYEAIFALQLVENPHFPGLRVFPYDRPAISGCLFAHGPTPTLDGTVVYLNCDGQLDAVLKRAQAAGGKILEEVAQLPAGLGWTAQIRDSEGNRVGLHSATA